MTFCKRCETFFGEDEDICPECDLATVIVPTCDECGTDLMRHHQHCPGCKEPVARVVSISTLECGYFEGNVPHMISLGR